MKPTYVFVQLKGPSGNHPGHIIDGHFIIEGDTVHLVDVNGEAEKDVDGTTYSRKLAANEHPKGRVSAGCTPGARPDLASGFASELPQIRRYEAKRRDLFSPENV